MVNVPGVFVIFGEFEFLKPRENTEMQNATESKGMSPLILIFLLSETESMSGSERFLDDCFGLEKNGAYS